MDQRDNTNIISKLKRTHFAIKCSTIELTQGQINIKCGMGKSGSDHITLECAIHGEGLLRKTQRGRLFKYYVIIHS